MKLRYNILWIDDQIEDIISLGVKDDIKEYLENLEFLTDIDCFETTSLAEDKLTRTKYDLILSDYNIEGGDEKGDALIKRIRNNEIFTEILFYSAQPNFKQEVIGLNRISYFSLENDEGYRNFKQEVKSLIDQTVYKLQELPAVRGMVMTETSILDSKVEDILLEFFSVENADTNKLREAILKRVENSLLDNFRKSKEFTKDLLTLKISEKLASEIVKDRICDASKKSRTIGEIIALRELGEKEEFKDFFKNYNEDVIQVRNKLAHAKSDIIDDKECLIINDEQTETYDAEKCIEIRKNLKKYYKCLDTLHKIIENTENKK